MKAADAVQVTKSIKHELLVILHAAGIYLQLIVIVAGCVKTFDDLFYICYHRRELSAELFAA